jgi:translation initiation factor IF-1
MPREDNIEAEGIVVETLRNAMFKVKLDSGHMVLCTISGKIRMHYIKILEGDRVKLEMSPYDITKGRITYRNKN